jgi:hypothetical protein
MPTTQNNIELASNRLPYSNANGLQISYVSTTSISSAAGVIRDSLNEVDILCSSALTLSISSVGAGALDAGTVAASTLYYVYVIYDQTGALNPALLGSLSATAPLLPTVYGTTYSHFAIIGTIATDGSSVIRPFRTAAGNGNDRYIEFVTPVPVLANASATTSTAVSLATVIPAVKFGQITTTVYYTPNLVANTGIVNNYTIYGSVATKVESHQVQLLPILVSGVPNVYYQVVSASDQMSILVAGYNISL